MVELRLLGPVELRVAGQAVQLGPPLRRAFFAVLAAEADRSVSAETLIHRVWGEDPPTEARASLYSHVSRLRRVLADAATAVEPREQVDGTPPQLLRLAGGYLLQVAPDRVDLHHYRQLSEQARDPALADVARAALLFKALGLWRGEPLAGVPGPWAARTRESWTQRRIDTFVEWANATTRSGSPALVLERLPDLVAEHPLVEPLVTALMRALQAVGRGSEALACYAGLRDRLAEELGTDPGPEAQQVHREVLRGHRATPHRPTGDFRLAADTRPAGDTDGPRTPEHPATPVVAGPPSDTGVPTDTGAVPAPQAVPRQLPAGVLGFVGREGHLKQLDALLPAQDDQAPGATGVIMVMSGTAGVGKTALAVHWAHGMRDRFPDGQLYVDLSGFGPTAPLRPVDVLGRFLRALGVPTEQVPAEQEEAAALYRSLLAGKRMLVLLDNAASADQVRPLRPAAPGCLAVVTSRDRLSGLVARDGARSLVLEVLTNAEAHDLLAQMLGEERARSDAEAAAWLVEWCGRLPLALRIAASDVAGRDNLGLARYAAELKDTDRLGSLAVDGDAQSAVRTAFDHSYRALPPEARRMFRLTAAAPTPDVTVDAAAALADVTPRQAHEVLARLAAASLVHQQSPGRYSFHDLVRLYGTECAEEESPADRAEATSRLHRYYLATVTAASQLLYPDKLRLPADAMGAVGSTESVPQQAATVLKDESAALGWLNAEQPNMRSVIEDAARHGSRKTAWLLADRLRGFFWLGSHASDWLAVAQAGLAAARADGNAWAEGAARLSLGDACMRQGRFGSALEHYTGALACTQSVGWRDGQAAVLSNLAGVHWEQGRPRQATDHLARALVINVETGRIAGQAAILGNLGILCRELGQLDRSAEYHRQALVLDERIGSAVPAAIDLANLAEAICLQGRLAEAEHVLLRALHLHRELGDRDTESYTLYVLARLQRDLDRPRQSLDTARTALALARENDHTRHEVDALNALASAHLMLADHDRALSHYEQALRILRETGQDHCHAAVESLVGLADTHHRTGRGTPAAELAHRTLHTSRRTGYRLLEGQALTVLAGIALVGGAPSQAAEHAQRAVEVHRATGHRMGRVQALHQLARAVQQTHGNTAALSLRREAEAIHLRMRAR
ncbi:BTAD domain-containing putative transcriptional regulator [Streptomyces sp. NPDC006365]|uniref:AfsR/SARP family transcriptional regulator n=1 Tax=Streptomyces sp. NPDC006365 TaxID=3364744 RepID=UPI0036C1EEF5